MFLRHWNFETNTKKKIEDYYPMYVLGLTGSIAMGKSTVAQMFRDIHIPVHDADASVHALYQGKAVPLIEREFQGTTDRGVVDRRRLGDIVLNDPQALKRLEDLIHPLVREREQDFIKHAGRDQAPFVVLDIPLLFETGAEKRLDGVIVVTADPEEQERRVLSRPGMTPEKFRAILDRQIPDSEKRAKADFVINTHSVVEGPKSELFEKNMAATRLRVDEIKDQIISGEWSPARARKSPN